MERVLDVRDLTTVFHTRSGTNVAVDHVSFHLNAGEIIGVVGESGSGKSVTMMSLLKLVAEPGEVRSGEVFIRGVEENLLSLPQGSPILQEVRGKRIGFVFQEPTTTLNPVLTVGYQIGEVLRYHTDMSKAKIRARCIELLTMVGIPDAENRVDYYPQQFSGGMRQRIVMAMAMACQPDVLIADEATTALDVTTQAQLLEMLHGFAVEQGIAIIVVTHNLGIIARYASRIYVMYSGRIMEEASTRELFLQPGHPYTRSLLRAIPKLNDKRDRKLIPIEGLPPTPETRPDYCPFYDRCVYRCDSCRETKPELTDITPDHRTACCRTQEELNEQEKTMNLEGEVITGEKQIGDILLEVHDLTKRFPVRKGFFQRKVGEVYSLQQVNLSLRKGETLGVVGESGCGKTTLARCVIRGYMPDEGSILFDGKDLAKLTEKELRPVRPKIAMIFQDPFSSLDPRQTVASIVGEPLIINKLVKDKAAYDKRVDELLQLVGLNPDYKFRNPHEFSGGQRQRLGIARALASNPSVIICDEPISALDVSIQAQIINLLEDLQKRLGLSYLFIAHDLAVVKHISDRIAVMYLGHVVELADSDALYTNPLHPYTQALMSAVPIADVDVDQSEETRIKLLGSIPSVLKRPDGCPFCDRCPHSTDQCRREVPRLRDAGNGHQVACFLK